ncbi:hypothetical protein JMJ35_004486 [Cladonia borealis]|uniref:Uncharacterized protein n=1 Tax=Cladonia borealis TaxID=184061 RepID=A0AA39R460_9LECA|nr:hypothetical protein JMJ35_004486 [Cladonia borealis]
MREYRNNECKDRNGIEDLLKRLHIALNELRDTEMHGRSSGQMPHCTRYDEGTYMEGQQSSPYEPLQSLRRCIAKAIERARVKIKSSTRCDSEWHTLEKYSPSVSYTQPSLGKGAQSVVHNESFCRHFEQTSGRDLRVFELSCLIMGKTMCPPLQWLFLRSLTSEPPSILDRSMFDLIPSLSQIVTILSRHHTITLSIWFISTSLTALALFIPLSHTSESCRPPVLFCCCLALVASGPLWTYIGGSAASFFLVFMPYAMSVGISLGLLWCWFVTERECRIGVTQDELQRKASFSKVADTS